MSHQQETTKILNCYNELSLHHREIKEEQKSGKIIGEIRIGPKRYYCAVAALNIGIPPLFKKGRIC